MAVLLPSDPYPGAGTSPRYIDYGGELAPALGGPVQKLNRLGDRYALDVVLPPMEAEPTGRVFIQRLTRARKVGALMEFPQLGLVIGAPGAPLVNGAVAGGTSVPVKGLTPGYVVREGQFFSIVVSGRRYLHSSDSEVIANGSGLATLTVSPMLRVPLSNNDVIEIASPKIEGLVQGNATAWDLDLAETIGLSFSIVEAE